MSDRMRAVPAGTEADEEIEALPDFCARPRCRKRFERKPLRGRPQAYCSEACRREAEKERRQTESRLRHFEGLVEQTRIDVAAFRRGRSDDSVSPVDLHEAARGALREARGLLRLPADPDNPYAEVLQQLYDAVDPLLNADSTAASA